MTDLARLVSLDSDSLKRIVAGAKLPTAPAYRVAVATLRARRLRELGRPLAAEEQEAEAFALLCA